MIKNIFFKQPTPDELFRKWRSTIRTQERTIDRQIRGIESEEKKAKMAIKQVAKRKDMVSCKILAKELVRTRKHKERLHTSKAQLNSIMMQLQQQTAMAKMSGTLQKSAEVMKLVNNLVKLPEINKAMMELSKELMKTGIIGEMIEDTIDGLDEEIDSEAEEEVNKILFEITEGSLGEVQPVNNELITDTQEPIQEQVQDEDWDDMRARLSALRD